MDMTAITLCQENNLPIIVFDMNKPGNLQNLVAGKEVGTIAHYHLIASYFSFYEYFNNAFPWKKKFSCTLMLRAI